MAQFDVSFRDKNSKKKYNYKWYILRGKVTYKSAMEYVLKKHPGADNISIAEDHRVIIDL